MRKWFQFIVIGILLLALLAGCGDDPASTGEANGAGNTAVPDAAAVASPSPADTAPPPTPTSIPPTPTPTEPLAATVNGQPIFLADYEQELARYEKAQVEMGIVPGGDGTDYHRLVLDALIEQELIAQYGAVQEITVSPEAVDARMTDLEASVGEQANFEAWLEANQWTREEFREALGREMLVEQVVAAVTADVPTTVEQVKARYLQVDDPALADSLLNQIQAGADFGPLAEQHSLDRVTAVNNGDLGFFARGSLLVPAVEEAAFALQPGEVSDVITATDAEGTPTYYLVQTTDRDPQRPLTADMRYTLLQQAFEAWLDQQWAQAEVVRMVNGE